MAPPTYALDLAWPALLQGAGLSAGRVLQRAGLPADLFSRPRTRLEAPDYFRLWEAMEAEAGDGLLPVRLYAAARSESFSAPLFAALCSPDLLTALERLARYKTLVAPMRLEVAEGRGAVSARLTWLDRAARPPTGLVLSELLFLVSLARLGTRSPVRPLRVLSPLLPGPAGPYRELLGVRVERGDAPEVRFAAADARRPFLSSNEGLWAVFEPELRRRLAELDADASTAERVRATLLEGLPGGELSMGAVARRLALSTRTLQRRLEAEGTSYQQVLRTTREALARDYLSRTRLPVAEISFLLGFSEPNSFFRAFGAWTGTTPEQLRRRALTARAS